jgi:biotin carboxyl carrier protein
MSRKYTILLEDEEHSVEVKKEGDSYLLKMEGEEHRFTLLLNRAPIYSFLIDDAKVLEADISFNQDSCEMNVRHVPYVMEVFDPRTRLVSQSEFGAGGADHGLITAPMPGKVVDVKVSAGAKVKKGEAVVIVEAMKMQNELPSPFDGVVKEVHVKTGDTVESGQKMVLISKE